MLQWRLSASEKTSLESERCFMHATWTAVPLSFSSTNWFHWPSSFCCVAQPFQRLALNSSLLWCFKRFWILFSKRLFIYYLTRTLNHTIIQNTILVSLKTIQNTFLWVSVITLVMIQTDMNEYYSMNHLRVIMKQQVFFGKAVLPLFVDRTVLIWSSSGKACLLLTCMNRFRWL